MAIDNVAKLFPGITAPKKVIIIYFNFQDTSWAQSEWNKYALRPDGAEASRSCRTAETCWGGLAEIDLKGNALLMIGSIANGIVWPAGIIYNHTSGMVEAHEYTHTVQSTQFINSKDPSFAYCCTKAYLPWWIVEGNAVFSETVSMNTDSYKRYLSDRTNATSEFTSNKDKTFTTDWITEFLNIDARDIWIKQVNNQRIYDFGMLVNEILVALKGPDSPMKVIKGVSEGKTWSAAFNDVFGITWEEATPILAKVISAMVTR
jgi:hypothetical protein